MDRKMYSVSLCMIVKNEEAVIGRCLESVQGMVDEIIIVDTGSEDRTKEIVERYTDKIYDFSWRDDFAAAERTRKIYGAQESARSVSFYRYDAL